MNETRLVITIVASIALFLFAILLIVIACAYKKTKKVKDNSQDPLIVANIKQEIKDKSKDLRYYFPTRPGLNNVIRNETKWRLRRLISCIIFFMLMCILAIILVNVL